MTTRDDGRQYAAQALMGEREAARRAHVMKPENSRYRNFLWFFYELDRRTLPPSFLYGWQYHTPFEKARVDLIKGIMVYLNARVRARISGERVPIEANRDRGLTELSWLQRPMYESCLRDSMDPRAARYAYAKAFVLFAGGHFYVHEELKGWNIGPNSNQYVLFAEYSLACIDHGVDARFWRLPLPGQVLSQPAFRQAFPTGSGPCEPFDGLEAEAERIAVECGEDPPHSTLVSRHTEFLREVVADVPDAFGSARHPQPGG